MDEDFRDLIEAEREQLALAPEEWQREMDGANRQAIERALADGRVSITRILRGCQSAAHWMPRRVPRPCAAIQRWRSVGDFSEGAMSNYYRIINLASSDLSPVRLR